MRALECILRSEENYEDMRNESRDEMNMNATSGISDKEEFCRMYAECKDKLYRYALYRLKSSEEAEDAVSDAVLAAWKSRSSLRDPEAFTSWIFSILANICNSHIRQMIRDREKAAKSEDKRKLISFESPSLSLELREALAILSGEDQNIILLSVIGGLSSKEISSQTGLAPGSVRSRLSRSLAKMREYLEE